MQGRSGLASSNGASLDPKLIAFFRSGRVGVQMVVGGVATALGGIKTYKVESVLQVQVQRQREAATIDGAMSWSRCFPSFLAL